MGRRACAGRPTGPAAARRLWPYLPWSQSAISKPQTETLVSTRSCCCAASPSTRLVLSAPAGAAALAAWPRTCRLRRRRIAVAAAAPLGCLRVLLAQSSGAARHAAFARRLRAARRTLGSAARHSAANCSCCCAAPTPPLRRRLEEPNIHRRRRELEGVAAQVGIIGECGRVLGTKSPQRRRGAGPAPHEGAAVLKKRVASAKSGRSPPRSRASSEDSIVASRARCGCGPEAWGCQPRSAHWPVGLPAFP